MDSGLADKRVLITGGSGGISSAFARAFAGEACRIVIHYYRGRQRAEALASDLEGVVPVQADLTSEDDMDGLFAEVRSELGGLDVCAAVAGVWPEEDVPVWNLPLERWNATLTANLTATFLTARAFLREVEAQATGASCSSARRRASSARPGTPTTPLRSRP
jgi:NAD(P)-dependent dehydrogenase (short-subunit alcohol dehydrogenase family)